MNINFRDLSRVNDCFGESEYQSEIRFKLEERLITLSTGVPNCSIVPIETVTVSYTHLTLPTTPYV